MTQDKADTKAGTYQLRSIKSELEIAFSALQRNTRYICSAPLPTVDIAHENKTARQAVQNAIQKIEHYFQV